MQYDIVGDIHGQADKLEALLKTMGYQHQGGAYRHPSRTAVFVGDFIDRGPRQVDTCRLVREMVDAGSAQAVMGNHEFNAVAWFMRDPEAPNEERCGRATARRAGSTASSTRPSWPRWRAHRCTRN